MYNSYNGVDFNNTDRPYVYENESVLYQCYPGLNLNTTTPGETFIVIHCDPSTHQYNFSLIIPECVSEMPCPDPIDFGLPVNSNHTVSNTYMTDHIVTYSCTNGLYELQIDGAHNATDTYDSTCGWGDWSIGASILSCPRN